MVHFPSWGRALLCAACCLSIFAESGDTGNPFQQAAKPNLDKFDKMDRSWKRYHNSDRGYCVSYPAKWSRGSGFDGSGIFVETGLRRYSKPTGEIDIGPMELESSEDAKLKPANFTEDILTKDLQEHLAGLQKFARAERLQIIDQHSINVQGAKALYVKNQYYDPLERSHWLEEVVFVRRKGELYRLEMQCPPDQVARFEPVFAYVVNSLDFECR